MQANRHFAVEDNSVEKSNYDKIVVVKKIKEHSKALEKTQH